MSGPSIIDEIAEILLECLGEDDEPEPKRKPEKKKRKPRKKKKGAKDA